jgi:hypothetical protein
MVESNPNALQSELASVGFPLRVQAIFRDYSRSAIGRGNLYEEHAGHEVFIRCCHDMVACSPQEVLLNPGCSIWLKVEGLIPRPLPKNSIDQPTKYSRQSKLKDGEPVDHEPQEADEINESNDEIDGDSETDNGEVDEGTAVETEQVYAEEA